MNMMHPNEPPTEEDEEAYAYFSTPALFHDRVIKIARQLDDTTEITKQSVNLADRRQIRSVSELRDLVSEMDSICRAIDKTLDELSPRQLLTVPQGPAPF